MQADRPPNASQVRRKSVRRRALAVWLGLRRRAEALLQRLLPNEAQHLFALTLVVGLVCGLVAVAFHLAIRGAEHLLIERALEAPGWTRDAWMIVTPTLAGLLVGAVLTYVVPGARGSGIPQIKAAFALQNGKVSARDAFGKFWLSAIQIGAGASLGREGPTVQVCAGATSLLARPRRCRPRTCGGCSRSAWRRASPRRSTPPSPR